MVNIEGLNKADVLAALYNASRPQGMGFLNYDPAPMSRETAQNNLDKTTYFDYLGGRVMKVDLAGDAEFRESLYDRDNGEGAAQRAIDALRASGPLCEDIAAAHADGVAQAAATTLNHINQETRMSRGDGMAVMHLGLSDVADHLRPAVEKAKAGN